MELLIDNNKAGHQLGKEELHKIYTRVFTTKDGKIILEDLANVSGMYRTNFVQGSSDYSSFLEGHRALFLYMCSQLEEKVNNIEGKSNVI